MASLINKAVDATHQTTMAMMWLLSDLATVMSGYFLYANYLMNVAAFRSLPIQHVGGEWEFRFGGALPIVAQVLASFWWYNGDHNGKKYTVVYLIIVATSFFVDSSVTMWYLTAGDLMTSWYSTIVAAVLTIVMYGAFSEYFFSWSISYCVVALPNMIEAVGYTAKLVNTGLVQAAKQLRTDDTDDDEQPSRVTNAAQRAAEQISQRAHNVR